MYCTAAPALSAPVLQRPMTLYWSLYNAVAKLRSGTKRAPITAPSDTALLLCVAAVYRRHIGM